MLIHVDAEQLRNCVEMTKDEVITILDLDLLDVMRTMREDQRIARITDIYMTKRLKMELLLGEVDRQQGELARVIVEAVNDFQVPAIRIVSVLKAVMTAADLTQKWHFTFDGSIAFRITPAAYREEFCNTTRLQDTFREIFAAQVLPTYDALETLFQGDVLALGTFSRLRAAYELSQACLLFLRTTWLNGLCRCGIRCGIISSTPTSTRHHFGLELAPLVHRAPQWSIPNTPNESSEGELEHSWCTRDETFGWHGLNVPLRHLGLLIIELSLGLVVYPVTDRSRPGAPVTSVYVMIRNERGVLQWRSLSRRDLLRHIMRGFNGSEPVGTAIDHCLTASMPDLPSDTQFEKCLEDFYYRIVRPFQHQFNAQLDTGAFSD